MLSQLIKLGTEWAERQKPIVIHSDRCTHTRHKASTCNACQTVCPFDAINLKDGLCIDWSCTGCGLCTSICPTEAIEMKVESNKEYYTTLKAYSETNEILFFHCKQMDGMQQETGKMLSCLGQLDDLGVQLAIANGITEFNFLTEPCSSCQLKQGFQLFKQKLVKWRERWPMIKWHEMDKKTYLSQIIQEQGKKEEQSDDLNLMDRREFFKIFGKETKQIIVRSVVKQKEQSPWKDGQLVSQKSIRLQVYEHWIKPKQKESIPMMDKSLKLNEEQCTYCGICEKVCPTEAIKLTESEKNFTWIQEQCIDCHLCEDVCYRKAITFL
ncbi:ATP-binding protein [Tepidibacillus sp. HK-1]|uniref:ATP-binding protein n=1 Tax=Tepidibacillus sp. HK-1 TaxID=1883407 RepID=UPI00085292AB|nr:4Fe-4S binding protein [Tepidibacillus sp. HK-1]GBF11263.1 NADH dehydrogenase subunit I [Tepidibacillus sp. HK-1]